LRFQSLLLPDYTLFSDDNTDGSFNALVADYLPPHPVLLDEDPLPETTKECLLSNTIHDFKEARNNNDSREAEWDTYTQAIWHISTGNQSPQEEESLDEVSQLLQW
jgi:hypothetical protein